MNPRKERDPKPALDPNNDTPEAREQFLIELTAWKKRNYKNYISQIEYETVEDYYAALDKMYPRLSEPDEEGIDLNPADPRRRSIAVSAGATFRKADPLTEEDLIELAKLEKKLNLR